MTQPNYEMVPFTLPPCFGDDFEPAVEIVGVDAREHAVETIAEWAGLLCGDVVLVPFKDDAPAWGDTTRDTITKFAGHWSEIDLEDVPRLAVLTDGFSRFLENGEDVSVVTLWHGGAPIIQQIGGEPCAAALDVIMNAIVDDEPLQARPRTVNDDGQQSLPTTPPKALPAAANDNQPQPLQLTDWRSGRYAGEPEAIEYLVDGVIEAGIPGVIASMGEVGKSFLALELARRVAFGSSTYERQIFGGRVVQQGTAVLIAGEDDERVIHRRLAALDPKGARFADKGDKLVVVPMPSVAGGIRPYWRERRGEMIETDEWHRLTDQLGAIRDLRLFAFDPLQLFAAVPINEDPAAGQFVCGSIAALAAGTGTSVLTAHHMKKSGREIATLADARDAIRGTTALVDGMRLAYGLWYPEQGKAKALCKKLGVPWEPNRIAFGGVLKANGAARRIMTTYARNDFGLLVDRTADLGAAAPDQGDLRAALVIAVEAAAAEGLPFTKTGQAGLFDMRARLPEELQMLAKGKMDALAEDCLQRGDIVKATAKNEKIAKWLDVPGGWFARGLGEFKTGAAT